MAKAPYWTWFLFAWVITTVRAEVPVQTDLASISVTPLTRQSDASVAWQTVYDYSGGDVLPPGTRIISDSKWKPAVVTKDKSGVAFTFPEIPNQPSAAQRLNIGFSVERPLANYPTRATIHFTSYYNEVSRFGWRPMLLTSADYNGYREFFGMIGQADALPPDSKPEVNPTALRAVGENTVVFSYDENDRPSLTINGQDNTDRFRRFRSGETHPNRSGAMLINGIAFRDRIIQFQEQKGAWLSVNSFKIEQQRPPLEVSSVAAIDLVIPGHDPVQVTIEVTDADNASKGYVLRDATVAPGKYRLYWDGVDQRQSQPENTSWVASGSYTFRLTTSKTQVQYVGQPTNSTPPFNVDDYAMETCTALVMTPPGSPAAPPYFAQPLDTRQFDTTDSVQLLCSDYDTAYGQWVGANGEAIDVKTGDHTMQYGRGLGVTPPDPSAAGRQLYFADPGWMGSRIVVWPWRVAAPVIKPAQIPTKDELARIGQNLLGRNAPQKIFTSPDWNRPSGGFCSYKVQIGKFPFMIGPQHYLFFEAFPLAGVPLQYNYIYRNIRLYEEGSAEPQPIKFDASLFTPRVPSDIKHPSAIPSGSITLADEGHTVNFKNTTSLNYPFEYTITPHTILAFEVSVPDKSTISDKNGIGLDPQTSDWPFPQGEGRFFNFLYQGDDEPLRNIGFYSKSRGAHAYLFYIPNALYTDTQPPPPDDPPFTVSNFLFERGFYGLKVSEDGKLLFACNNADNRLEIRDISTTGDLVAKIPIDYPMYVSLAPEGAAGAPKGTRYIYVDSPDVGLMRIAWHVADNTFGKPEPLTPAVEFAYPRGLVYSAATNRIFICDTFNYDRSKKANQIVVIDPLTGKVLSRFGKPGGVDITKGGVISDDVFTCPLTIDADSKGAVWVNDLYTGEVRKYHLDFGTNGFSLERRVIGPNKTNISQFYWLPGGSPNQVWTFNDNLVRHEADFGPDGYYTNQRTTNTTIDPIPFDKGRPYAHFAKIGDHIYDVMFRKIYELVDNNWIQNFEFGNKAGDAARKAGLLAKPGEPPTDLDKTIAASGDVNWADRAWAWSDINGDGKMEYSADNPEFQIAFNSDLAFDGYNNASGVLRSPDGAYVHSGKTISSGKGEFGLLVIPSKTFNGKTLYTWDEAKFIPRTPDSQRTPIIDVLAQDGRYYALRSSTQRHDMGSAVVNKLECYDDTGKVLWTRDQSDRSVTSLQSLGDGMISIMDRGSFFLEGPVMIRTKDGDLVSQAFCREAGDCWAHGALRANADTAYIGLVQAYKVTGLSTTNSAAVTVDLSSAAPANNAQPKTN